MSLGNHRRRSVIIGLALSMCASLLVGCGSSESSEVEEAAQPYFDHSSYMADLKRNRSNCKLIYLSPDHQKDYWKSKRESESYEYSWIEYDSLSDYYDFRLEDEDGSYAGFDDEDVVLTQKCISFLATQIESLKVYEEVDAKKLLGLYQSLLSNRQGYLEQSQLMAGLEFTKANRAKYLELEGAKRGFSDSLELIFYEIRKLIDFFYYGSVKVHLERCPDAFSIFGNDTINDGSVLLTNTSDSSATVDLTVRYKDSEGVIVGDSLIYETVPGKSKVRVDISAAGSSEAVGGGAYYPPSCTFD